MRIWDRSIVGSVLVLAGVAATPIIACSSSDGASGTASGGIGDEGGIITPGGEAGTGVDGGPVGPAPCTTGADCPSKICNPSKMCAAPTCSDGAQNQNETDLDCGGSCTACDVKKKCLVGSDCLSKVCADKGSGLQCQPPSSTDGVQNGTETDVDCGGTGNPQCPSGDKCAVRSDCSSDVCTAGKCITPVCDDGILNGTETAVDCGGPACPRCGDNLGCKVAGDCTDGVCADVGAGLQCQPPSYTDTVKNGAETDVDCGGSGDPTNNACPATKSCLVDTDCMSVGCDYTKHCAISRSCTGNSTGGRYGADTCGLGGAGGLGAPSWESCCEKVDVTVTEGTPATTQTVHLDKYKVTSGRMRAFLESVGGDVRSFVQTARAAGQIPVLPITSSSNPAGTTVLPPAWDRYLPTSTTGDAAETPDCDQGSWNESTKSCRAGTEYAPMYTAARQHVGPTIFKANSQTQQGCGYDNPGTHTYYMGNPDYYNAVPDFDQTIYDQKPLQCVDYVVAQAFCIWDGGRLETTQEWFAASSSSAQPWTTTGQMDTRGISSASLTMKSDLPGSGGNGTTATYTACRFPTATDLLLNTPAYVAMTGCAAWTIPSATQTIEFADYQYNYEWPNLNHNDFSVFISPPGRTVGRAPSGAADIAGNTFEISSNITSYNDNPFPTASPSFDGSKVAWSGNGSWEVHGYVHGSGGNGSYRILDKYGKMGLRCVHVD